MRLNAPNGRPRVTHGAGRAARGRVTWRHVTFPAKPAGHRHPARRSACMAQLSFASAAPRPSLVRTARLVRAVPTVASAMSIDEIIPNLFLGDLIAAKSPELLSSLGITHVLSLISEDFGFRGEAFGILHKQFLVQDARSQNLLAYLIEGVEWIENAFLGVHPVIEPTKPARAPSNNKPRQLADDNYKLATQMKDGTVSVYENDASTTKDQGEQAPAGSSPDAAMDTIMDFSEDSTTTITIETPASSDEKQPSNEALMRAMVLNREVKVFVHCRMGISRSCSVIIAYGLSTHIFPPS